MPSVLQAAARSKDELLSASASTQWPLPVFFRLLPPAVLPVCKQSCTADHSSANKKDQSATGICDVDPLGVTDPSTESEKIPEKA